MSHRSFGVPPLRLRDERETRRSFYSCGPGLLLQWNDRRGLSCPIACRPHVYARQQGITLGQALDSTGRTDLAELAADLRAARLEVSAHRYQRAEQLTLLHWSVTPDHGLTLGRLWTAIEQALMVGGVIPAGTTVRIELHGEPHHPPEPQPKRQPLGVRR